MPLNWPRSGPNDSSAYITSGLPYVTASSATSGSVTRIDFPFVTKFITVKNASPAGNLAFGFTASGTLGTNRFTLAASSSFTGDLRIKSLYLTSVSSNSTAFEVLSGLTMIDSRWFPNLTGSLAATDPANTGSFQIPSGIG